MANMKTTGGVLYFSIVAIGVLAMLAVADGQMFKDAAFSGLYKFTLDQAFNRFDASDQQVPAGGAAAGANRAADPMEAAMAGQPRAGGEAAGVPHINPMQGMQRGQQHRIQMGGGGQQAAQMRGMAPASSPHLEAGRTYLSTSQFDKAIQEFQLAVRDNPSDQLALHSLGDAYRYAGKPDEAIAAYQQVLQLNPSYVCCHMHIAETARMKGDAATSNAQYEAAIAGYKEMLGQGEPYASDARFHLAKIYSDTGQHLDEALQFAQQAVAEHAGEFAYVQLLAQVYARVGKTQEAIATYEELKKANPQYATMIDTQIRRLRQGGTALQGPQPPAANQDNSNGNE